MKVALIGIGKWGSILLKELEEQVEVKYKCETGFDLNQVWNDPEIEAVFIATPIPTHFEIAEAALNAGKHVFLEKPGTDSSEKLGRLIELSEAKKLVLAIGYEFPHHPGIQKLKTLIEGKEVVFARTEFEKWGTFKDSIVTNLLCHDISILQFLGLSTDMPKANKVPVITEADIIATRFGTNVMSVVNRVSPLKQRTIIVILTDAKYLWDGTKLFEIIGEEMKGIETATTSPVAAEIADFLEAIKNNRTPLSSGHFGLDVYKVIEQIQ